MEIKIELEAAKEIGIGSNVLAVQQDPYLIFVIDIGKDLGPSSSGKMRAVANTGGFQVMPGDLKGNIYIGKKL